jgi:hypothetical protein
MLLNSASRSTFHLAHVIEQVLHRLKRQIYIRKPTAKSILNNFRQMKIMFLREDFPSFPETTKYVEMMPF